MQRLWKSARSRALPNAAFPPIHSRRYKPMFPQSLLRPSAILLLTIGASDTGALRRRLYRFPSPATILTLLPTPVKPLASRRLWISALRTGSKRARQTTAASRIMTDYLRAALPAPLPIPSPGATPFFNCSRSAAITPSCCVILPPIPAPSC